MMLTTLLRALQIMDLKLAGTVHLKVDGGSENWNSTVLAVLDLLFDMYPELKEIVVSRFGAGHTHADLDRIYGYLNQVLFGMSPGGHRAGRNIYSREEFFQLLEQALQTSNDTALLAMKVEDLLFTFDFKSLVAPHLYSEFKGHGSSGQIHVFRFRRVDGSPQPHISYKYWHQSPTWLPADGSSLRILNSRPDLRDAKQVKVSPYVAGAMNDLPALQQTLLHW